MDGRYDDGKLPDTGCSDWLNEIDNIGASEPILQYRTSDVRYLMFDSQRIISDVRYPVSDVRVLSRDCRLERIDIRYVFARGILTALDR